MPRKARARSPDEMLEGSMAYDLLPVSSSLPPEEIGLRQFVNRWTWNTPRAVVLADLRKVVDQLGEEGVTCPILSMP